MCCMLNLIAVFMTGFYSKDFILESAYGQFYFSGTVVYFIATIGAMFTTLYSVKVLYVTFLTNPNGPSVNYGYLTKRDRDICTNLEEFSVYLRTTEEGRIYDYILSKLKPAHEGDFFLSIPLIILALFSIFFGYVTKDIFVGLGSGFFSDNSIFIHPLHEITIDVEFGVPVIMKLLPLILTVLVSLVAIILSEFLPKVLIGFKLSRLGYNIFGFFNQRFLIEMFYNKYVTNFIWNLGGISTKIIDKGSVEMLGPYGLESALIKLSHNISSLSTGVVTSYALYILTGFISYLLIILLNLNMDLNFLILICIVATLMPIYRLKHYDAAEGKVKRIQPH
jgi:NADH-ubiquinone oxidoreductase chain 5